jgi:long-chain acyl-CoA synthetase
LAGSAAVFGVPNEEWGEEVKAVLEPSPDIDGDEALAQEVLAFCEGKLARYKLPRSIDFTDRLPRSDNGKLYKRTLREPYWRHHAKRI